MLSPIKQNQSLLTLCIIIVILLDKNYLTCSILWQINHAQIKQNQSLKTLKNQKILTCFPFYVLSSYYWTVPLSHSAPALVSHCLCWMATSTTNTINNFSTVLSHFLLFFLHFFLYFYISVLELGDGLIYICLQTQYFYKSFPC